MDGFGPNLCPLAELVIKCAESLGSVTGELFSSQIFKIIYTSACHLVRIEMNGSSNKSYKDQFTDEGDTLLYKNYLTSRNYYIASLVYCSCNNTF